MTSRAEELNARGYIVVEDVVPRRLCEAVIDATAAFLGIGPDDGAGWRRRQIHGHGIVPLHHGQALWNVRQWPKIYDLFRELLGAADLWVTMDRVSFKAPAAAWDGSARISGFHWDADPRGPRLPSFQGLVYLRDTADDQGAFCCLPDVYADLPAWLAEHGDDAGAALNDGRGRVQAVGAGAGSMVIWHRQMPHSSGRNEGERPRWVQYVAMDPAGDESQRRQRVRLYEHQRPPDWAVRQRVPGQLDPEPWPRARLTPLGRRLVGYRSAAEGGSGTLSTTP